MGIFPPPVGLPLLDSDSLRISQSFIYRKKHFWRMNSVIKRVLHCIKLTLTKDWTIHGCVSLAAKRRVPLLRLRLRKLRRSHDRGWVVSHCNRGTKTAQQYLHCGTNR